MLNRFLRAGGLLLGALCCLIGDVRGDNDYTVTYSTPANMQVKIEYYGQSSPSTTYAVPFTLSPQPSGTSITAFCVDLWHTEQGSNSTFYSSSTVTSSFASTVQSEAGSPNPAIATDPTVTNELTYLGTVFQSFKGSDTDQTAELGALQLAIWHVIDAADFKVTSWPSDSNVLTYYEKITGWNGTNYTGSGLLTGTNEALGGSTITAYLSGDTYTGAEILLNDASKSENQNVLTWGSITATPQTQGTPEPSSFAIAGLGAMAFAGYGLRRRKAARRTPSTELAIVNTSSDAGDSLPAVTS